MTRDLALHELLVSDGIAAADAADGSAGHVTARRMAPMLPSRSQNPDLMPGPIRLARAGAITHELKGRPRHAEPACREAAG